MAEPHLDHPGDVLWYAGQAPAAVIAPCPHGSCPHNQLAVIAEGPDWMHYTLDRCDVPAAEGGCGGTCRAWCGLREGRLSRRQRTEWAPWLHVDVPAAAGRA